MGVQMHNPLCFLAIAVQDRRNQPVLLLDGAEFAVAERFLIDANIAQHLEKRAVQYFCKEHKSRVFRGACDGHANVHDYLNG